MLITGDLSGKLDELKSYSVVKGIALLALLRTEREDFTPCDFGVKKS